MKVYYHQSKNQRAFLEKFFTIEKKIIKINQK